MEEGSTEAEEAQEARERATHHDGAKVGRPKARSRADYARKLRRVKLVQLGVFGLGGEEDGDAGVSVFPQREEILIGGAGFGGVAL